MANRGDENGVGHSYIKVITARVGNCEFNWIIKGSIEGGTLWTIRSYSVCLYPRSEILYSLDIIISYIGLEECLAR